MKGLARRNCEKHPILAEIEEEEQDVKALPWHAVRKARDQELSTYVTSECMRKSLNVKPLHNTRSLQ